MQQTKDYIPKEERIKKYERTNIEIVKSKTGKSLTMVILKSDFSDSSDELVLNVNLEHFIADFIVGDRHSYKWNRIRYV